MLFWLTCAWSYFWENSFRKRRWSYFEDKATYKTHTKHTMLPAVSTHTHNAHVHSLNMCTYTSHTHTHTWETDWSYQLPCWRWWREKKSSRKLWWRHGYRKEGYKDTTLWVVITNRAKINSSYYSSCCWVTWSYDIKTNWAIVIWHQN